MTYIQGYIIEIEKIMKFFKITDPKDRKIDDVFCKINEYFNPEENPVLASVRDGRSIFVILLGPDAYADDIKTLEAKNLQPTKFMAEIAPTLFTGPCILPMMAEFSNEVGFSLPVCSQEMFEKIQ